MSQTASAARHEYDPGWAEAPLPRGTCARSAPDPHDVPRSEPRPCRACVPLSARAALAREARQTGNRCRQASGTRPMTRSPCSLGSLGACFLIVALGLAALGGTGCATQSLRAAVSLSMAGAKGTPSDASVYIDEQYVGPLYYVGARGVRLPEGQHRITVSREGYFNWDTVVVADRDPIALKVVLVPVPD